MFRFMRPSKTILSVSRLPLRVESRVARGEVNNIQTVRLQSERLRPRNVVVTVLAVYMSAWVYSKLVIDPLARTASDADLDPEEETPPIFIPFPGTTKVLPELRQYQPSDPEYQAVRKVCTTEGQLDHMREDLAKLMRDIVRADKRVTARYGREMNVSRYWLNISFHPYAPPVVVRSGIEITDDYIAWTVVPVDIDTVFKIRRALWPSALTMSLWSFAKTIAIDDMKRAARILGVQIGSNPPTIEELLSNQRQMPKFSHSTKERTTSKQPQLLGDTETQKSAVLTTKSSSLDKKVPAQEELSAGREKRTVSVFHENISHGILAFKTKLQQTWKPPPSYPPGASLTVEGLVELQAQKSVILVSVRAHWDPKTRSYHTGSLMVRIVSILGQSQPPVQS